MALMCPKGQSLISPDAVKWGLEYQVVDRFCVVLVPVCFISVVLLYHLRLYSALKQHWISVT